MPPSAKVATQAAPSAEAPAGAAIGGGISVGDATHIPPSADTSARETGQAASSADAPAGAGIDGGVLLGMLLMSPLLQMRLRQKLPRLPPQEMGLVQVRGLVAQNASPCPRSGSDQITSRKRNSSDIMRSHES
jgi:hypothetical protein